MKESTRELIALLRRFNRFIPFLRYVAADLIWTKRQTGENVLAEIQETVSGWIAS